jgi:anti-anti-sigma factor
VAARAPFAIESVRVGGTQRIRLRGELDATVTPLLEKELMRVEEGDAESIVIDLCGLDRLDSCGLRLLLTASARSRQHGGRLALLRGPDHVHRIFETAGLVSRLPFPRPDR